MSKSTNRDPNKIYFSGRGRTRQSFKDSCDINSIIGRWKKDGVLPHMSASAPQFVDLTDAHDYKASLDRVFDAQEAFYTLHPSLRKRFDNDPAEFLSYMDDPSNIPEMVDLGLIAAEVAEAFGGEPTIAGSDVVAPETAKTVPEAAS